MRSLIVGCLALFLFFGLSSGTSAEPGRYSLGHIPVDPAIVKAKTRYLPVKALQATLDWRDFGAVTPAKNQLDCRSCWAFAVTGCVESHIIIDAGGPGLDLSEQYLVSCAGDEYGTCCGGNCTAFNFLQMSELKGEGDFPYGNGDAYGPDHCAPNYVPCPADIQGAGDYWVQAWWTIPQDADQLKANLARGPFYVAFNVYEDFMDYWDSGTGGVYSYSYGGLIGFHAVLLIGYDENEGCWIIKNSWGETRGPFGDGTARISYEAGCNFAFNAATCSVTAGGKFSGLADARYAHVLTSTAAGDSIYLLGGPGRQDGKFQDDGGTVPNAEGWVGVSHPAAVGSFSQVWRFLDDVDLCASNYTPQVAFIDDGLVVPGTGGSLGITWTYGPFGYVVNGRGGLAGPENHLHNEIWSPQLGWPAYDYDGCLYSFDVYSHLPLQAGIYYLWLVRSSNDGGASWSPWTDRGFRYYDDSADYLRVRNDVTDLLLPGRTHVQVALGVAECGWIWGYDSGDVTPAPYFDNVQVVAHHVNGPAITARDGELFQGANFPAIGEIDYYDLGANSVRVDMARNIAPPSHLRNDPGDSLVVDVSAVRSGSCLNGAPLIYYKLFPNPVFDPYRSGKSSDQGCCAMEMTQIPDADKGLGDRWYGDLPDSGFFFPGDVIHYYIEAQDNLLGDIGTSRLPADTSGFSYMPGMAGYVPMRYPSLFRVRALPSLKSGTCGDQPDVLFWNDAPECGGENEWIGALAQLGYVEGTDYDVYYTNGASLGMGNGLGGRATATQLADYGVMLYTSGDLSHFTLSNGDFNFDAGNDLGVLDDWLRQSNKNLFCTGDDLEHDLSLSGAMAVTFRNTWLAVTHNQGNIMPLIGYQNAPLVKPIAGNAVGLTEEYIAYGSCPTLNDFDAVTAGGTSTRIAEFTSSTGATGVYPYAAAVYNHVSGVNADIVYMPYDFMFIYTNDTTKVPASLATRAQVLRDILLFFGHAPGIGSGVGDTPALVFSATNFPNPFNPSVTIKYTMPRAGTLTITIYNVRGELVRTLLDKQILAGAGSITWEGDNNRAEKAASGIYFCEVKIDSERRLLKLALIK